jgi:hypothetical protein
MDVSRETLFQLVDGRGEPVRAFLAWADEIEAGWSMRLRNRPDIPDAAAAATLFPEEWWGHVVFSCFGSVAGTRTVAAAFNEPLPPAHAEEVLSALEFKPGSVGHHRIRPGVSGAKKALVGACGNPELFARVLHSDLDFESRFDALMSGRPPYWGRTTIFDLLLHAGALSIGGREVLPGRAYLAGSTGPAVGFRKVFGVTVTDENADWAESVLRAWTENWDAVARRVGTAWHGDPYTPGDFENALCIWQEPRWRAWVPTVAVTTGLSCARQKATESTSAQRADPRC